MEVRPVHFDKDENIHYRPEGVDADEYERVVYLSGVYQRGDWWMSRVPDDPKLPISQYTGQPYDPAWSTRRH